MTATARELPPLNGATTRRHRVGPLLALGRSVTPGVLAGAPGSAGSFPGTRRCAVHRGYQSRAASLLSRRSLPGRLDLGAVERPGVADSRDNRARALVVAGVIALVAAVHLSYQYVISPVYAYTKLTYASPNPAVYGALIAMIIALALIMPLKLARPADLILWVLYAVMVIPSLLISYLARTLNDTLQLTMGFVITGCFAAVIVAARLPTGTLSDRIVKLRPQVFWGAIIVFSAFTYVGLVTSGALRLVLPSLTEVYGVRAEFAGRLASSRLIGYLVPSQANVVNPLVIATGLYLRRWWMVALGVIGELVIYAAAAYKTVLFAIPVLLLVAVVFWKGRPRPSALIPWALVGVVGGSVIIDSLARTPWLTSLFTRRFMDVPGFLTGAWVNVFSQGPKALYAYSFLSPFFHYPYQLLPAHLVGAIALNSPDTSANANLFADGYANLGWFGVAFESAILAVVLVLANKLSHRMPPMVAFLLFVMPSITLANTSVLTTLTTHGLLLALVIIAVAPRSIWAVEPKRTAHQGAAVAGPACTAGAVTQAGPVPQSVGARPDSWWQRRKQQPVDATVDSGSHD